MVSLVPGFGPFHSCVSCFGIAFLFQSQILLYRVAGLDHRGDLRGKASFGVSAD